MRKYSLLVLAVALLFAMGMMAQTSSGSSGSNSQYPSSSDQSGQYGSAQTSTSDMGTAHKAKEKTIEGCVVRQATDFYLYPKVGQPQRIAATGQDVSAHLGHEVKLHGTEQPSSQASASGTTGGTAGTTGTSTAENKSSTAGTSGSMSSNTGAAGTPAAAGGEEFVVDHVTMVSESCPAKIKSEAQAAGMSTTPQ